MARQSPNVWTIGDTAYFKGVPWTVAKFHEPFGGVTLENKTAGRILRVHLSDLKRDPSSKPDTGG